MFTSENNHTNHSKKSQSRSPRRSITAALPHAYQTALLLRRIRRDSDSQLAVTIDWLLAAQKAVCCGLERLLGGAE